MSRSKGFKILTTEIYIFNLRVMRFEQRRSTYRVALLVDEFFGAWNTAVGGYGALSRKYLCKYIPDSNLQIDVLLYIGGSAIEQHIVDGTTLYRLPESKLARQKWLDAQGYDLFLSIEMTEPSFRILAEYDSNVPLLYWIQDPRSLDLYQPRLRTVKKIRDDDWSYLSEVAVWIQRAVGENRVQFISQGESLSQIVRQMYSLPNSCPIVDLPNPVDIDHDFTLSRVEKENKIVFLGRLEAQKRVWIVCEIARRMPTYEFVVIGRTGKGRDEDANALTLEPYRNVNGTSRIPNLVFAGHLDGEAKNAHLRTAKILLNTSIWEGIPVSWLEALSYGTLLVSAFDRDSIVERFGSFVGEVLGDGTNDDDLEKFVRAIHFWLSNDAERQRVSGEAITYVRSRHSIESFIVAMRHQIIGTADQNLIAEEGSSLYEDRLY